MAIPKPANPLDIESTSNGFNDMYNRETPEKVIVHFGPMTKEDEAMMAAERDDMYVTITRDRYDALMSAAAALDQCVDDFGAGQCVCAQSKQEAVEAVAALRAAGIQTEEM